MEFIVVFIRFAIMYFFYISCHACVYPFRMLHSSCHSDFYVGTVYLPSVCFRVDISLHPDRRSCLMHSAFSTFWRTTTTLSWRFETQKSLANCSFFLFAAEKLIASYDPSSVRIFRCRSWVQPFAKIVISRWEKNSIRQALPSRSDTKSLLRRLITKESASRTLQA